MDTSHDVNTLRGDERSHSIGFTASVLPEATASHNAASSHTGVSTKYASTLNQKHWYALRTTYGREKKAYDFIISHGGEAFMPTIFIEKVVKGKKKLLEVSRIPNIFFAYGTEETIKAFVYDNYNLPFLRFYYKHTHIGAKIEKTPMIVPNSQINSLKIICDTDANNNVLVLQEEIKKFKAGQRVQVVEGEFKGVEGIVARFHGQQRVGIVIDGLLTAATAYIPTAFLQEIDENS